MGNYATKAQVVAEGVPASKQGMIDARILKWEAIIEKLTRNIFYEVSPGELIFDGANSALLHFPLPLVSVSSVIINEETETLAATEYRAYTGKVPPQDHRGNPKIELTGERTGSVFTRTRGIFAKGLDQKITAIWGYVDPDPAIPGAFITPPAITDAVIQLVILDLDGYFAAGATGAPGVGSLPTTPLRREKTDDHELEYQMTEPAPAFSAMIPNAIYAQLMLYRAPMSIRVPDPRRFLSIPDVSQLAVT